MNKNMLELLDRISNDEGKIINNLIDGGVFTPDYVVRNAIESKKPDIIYYVAAYIENLSDRNIEELADALIETKDEEYISLFITWIGGAPSDKLEDALDKIEMERKLKEIPEDNDKKLDYLINLASSGEIDQIRFCNSAWTNLFTDEAEESHTQNKARVLKPDNK